MYVRDKLRAHGRLTLDNRIFIFFFIFVMAVLVYRKRVKMVIYKTKSFLLVHILIASRVLRAVWCTSFWKCIDHDILYVRTFKLMKPFWLV